MGRGRALQSTTVRLFAEIGKGGLSRGKGGRALAKSHNRVRACGRPRMGAAVTTRWNHS
jgi:hypothetical protein